MAGGSRIRRVLVGFDGSDASRCALDLALEVAGCLGAEVLALSVLPDTSHLETDEDRLAAEAGEREVLEVGLEPASRRALRGGLRFAHRAVAGGDPAEVISAFAAEHGFDLVVLGDHGRERAMHPGLGRVTSRLLRDPRCPVLISPAVAVR
jgi:nucleotide-binding universal stress UspA family protein